MAFKFDFKKRLGCGHFGEVWLAVDIGLNSECALKCIPPDKIINQGNFFHEAQILKSVQHLNIVKIYETGKLDDVRIYVAMEHLKKGSLEDEARGAYVPLTRAKRLMIDVLRGLEYAHSKGVIHRDIKPGNILIGNNNEGKLSDFGLALPNFSSLDLNLINEKYAYVIHLAPEVSALKDYSFLSDIYACGVTLYRLVNGDSYLPALINGVDIRDKTKKGIFPDRTSYRGFIPRSIKSIINKAIDTNPSKRFQSATEMRRVLEQMKININWCERLLSNGVKWSSGWNNKCYEVEKLEQKPGKWDITVKVGKNKDSIRRRRNLCFRGLSKFEADKRSQNILQGFVVGKIKS